jgi:hypothetical protein
MSPSGHSIRCPACTSIAFELSADGLARCTVCGGWFEILPSGHIAKVRVNRRPSDLQHFIDSLPLSVRAKNALKNSHISSLDELFALSATTLRGWKNVGKKTADEILSFVSEYVVFPAETEVTSAQLRPAETTQPRRIGSFVDGEITSDILSVQLPIRPSSAVDQPVMVRISDVLDLREDEATRRAGLDQRFWCDLRRLLAAHGIAFNWKPSPFELCKVPTTVDDELQVILQIAPNPDSRRKVAMYLGWDGGRGSTLQAVAETFGLSRERVRQLVRPVQSDLRLALEPWPYVKKAIESVTSWLPCTALEAELRLRRDGLVRGSLSVEGLVAAANVVSIDVPFQIVDDETRLIVSSRALDAVDKLRSISFRAISHHGAVSLKTALSELATERPDLTLSESDARIVVESMQGFGWLDDARDWFWLYEQGAKRNRLVNQIRKVLAIAPTISVEDLSAAIRRHAELADSAPPVHIIAEICRQLEDFVIVDNTVNAAVPLNVSDELSPSEREYLRVVHEAHRPLTRTQIEEEMIRRDISLPSVVAVLQYSPIVNRFAHNAYGLVGEQATPLPLPEPANTPQGISAEWAGRRRMRVVIPLRQPIVSSGIVSLPAAIRAHLTGKFSVIDTSGELCGSFTCGVNGSAWGLGRFFTRHGSDAVAIVLTFDLDERIAFAELIHTEQSISGDAEPSAVVREPTEETATSVERSTVPSAVVSVPSSNRITPMAGSTFQTNPFDLHKLLVDCHHGILQLPDFQRSWVWDEDRIKSLIASVSQAFPIGALMTLDTGGPVNFKPRPVEGAPMEAKSATPQSLLLDGQQRMTSLYHVTIRNDVVETITPKKKRVKRWFYIDIRRALDPTADREEAIVGVREDRVLRQDFDRQVVLDLSSREREYEMLMYPVSHIFDWDEWQDGFDEYWRGDQHEPVRAEFRRFKKQVLEVFKYYRIPVIALDRGTSKEAVCTVFEKVNTGGKPLDAFELVTAMYAASGHELRKDWYGDHNVKGRHKRLAETLRPASDETGILAQTANTDFLQAISLFYTRERRRLAEKSGKQGKELPAVTGNRQALLNLPLDAYKKYERQVEEGFTRAAKFLHMLHIYRIFDLPYQSQIVALAAILAEVGDAWEHEAIRAKLARWYWTGVFGELYGSTVESRIARDFIEVPAWLSGGPEPSTVSQTIFRDDRLKTMRSRLSAAYKGMNALLMKEGAQDFRSGQRFDHTVFFGENVDIHHIFPQDWCKRQGIPPTIYDSIINKTPLSYRTNRIIGGVAPSEYLARLERGSASTPPIAPETLNTHLRSHLVDPDLLRTDAFEAFMVDRQKRLLGLIEKATGKAAYKGTAAEEGVDAEVDEDAAEADLTIA